VVGDIDDIDQPQVIFKHYYIDNSYTFHFALTLMFFFLSVLNDLFFTQLSSRPWGRGRIIMPHISMQKLLIASDIC